MPKWLKRLSEPSTWASIAVVLGAFGVNVDQEIISNISQAGVALAAIAGIALREKGGS